jgi:hypothetical protein
MSQTHTIWVPTQADRTNIDVLRDAICREGPNVASDAAIISHARREAVASLQLQRDDIPALTTPAATAHETASVAVDSNLPLIANTDGACSGNPGPGGGRWFLARVAPSWTNGAVALSPRPTTKRASWSVYWSESARSVPTSPVPRAATPSIGWLPRWGSEVMRRPPDADHKSPEEVSAWSFTRRRRTHGPVGGTRLPPPGSSMLSIPDAPADSSANHVAASEPGAEPISPTIRTRTRRASPGRYDNGMSSSSTSLSVRRSPPAASARRSASAWADCRAWSRVMLEKIWSTSPLTWAIAAPTALATAWCSTRITELQPPT